MGKELTPYNRLTEVLNQQAAMIDGVAAKHIDAKKLIRVAQFAVQQQPALLKCDPYSVVTAVMLAARLGLEPDGVLGSGYIVPFGAKAQFIPGYRGLIDLARRSGVVTKIEAHLVYGPDRFEVDYGKNEPLTHIPNFHLDIDDRGEWYAVYAIATLTDGSKQVEVMTRDEVNLIRNRSKASGFGPWKTDYEEMARKTVVRRLVKYLPLKPEMAAASLLQAAAEGGVDHTKAAVITLDMSVSEPPQEDRPDAGDTLADELIGGDGGSGEEEPPPPGDEDGPFSDDAMGIDK